MDGKPIINLSGNGNLEILTDEKKQNIPTIEEITITIDDLDTPKENLAISRKYTIRTSNIRIYK